MSTLGGAIRSLRPPGRATGVALAIALPVLATMTASGLSTGRASALGVFLGALTGLSSAVCAVTTSVRAAVVLLTCLGAAAGCVAADSPLALAGCLIAASLVQAPLNRRAAGVGALLPAVPAITATLGSIDDAAAVAAGAVAGFAVVRASSLALGLAVPSDGVERSMSNRHALVLALLTTLCAPVVTTGADHGYWLVLTVAALLRPVPGETTRLAGQRLAGTVAGVAVAIAVVQLLPAPVAVAVALLCSIGTLAWTVARDEFRQTLFGTPVVVLVASSSPAGNEASAGAERLLLVGVGALGAIAASGLAIRADRRGQAC